MYQYPNYLAHHGVKGMKWGVRRARKSMAKRTRRKESSISDKEALQWKKDVKKGVKTGKVAWDKDYSSTFYSRADGRKISKSYYKAVDAEIKKRGNLKVIGLTGAATAGVAICAKMGIL